MEVAVGTAAGKIAPKLFDFLETNRKLRRELEHDIEYIKREFVMISAVIEEDGDQPPWNGNQVHKAWIQIVRDLSHAIEDCIDNFMHRVTLHSSASWIHRRFHRVKTVGARNKFAAAIRRLRKRSEDASKMRTSYITNNGGEKSNTMGSDEEEMEIDTSVATVGMNEPLDELMELISEGQEPKEEHKLKVISVVGFGGIGKTLLARQAYNDTIEKTQYEAWAWVRAADKDAGDVLKEILQELHTIHSGGSLNKLRASLREYLGTKRFFIVIDDMRALFWHDIKDAFPVVPGVSSRVMVTTAIQSVANACSSTHGHAYVMRTLDEEHSRQLFFQKASVEEHSPPLSDHTKIGTSEALMKCDGLPLALVSTAQFLQSRECKDKIGDSHLKEICNNLLLIRYLSLGGAVTVTTLPKEIKKLKLLETLDVRRTNIEILPTEVMKLPCLVHLFGKFKFQEGVGYRRMLKLQTWLKNKSKMETVAGFVVDERQEMPRLIEHMEHLTKMKIWCESTPDASINISHLSKAIKGFLERSTNLNKAHSLSLNFNSRWPQDLLCFSLEKDKLCYLRSLKLQGNKICSQLPLFVTNLYLLTKLCLSFPGHNLGDDILDALTKVRGLEHLKLIATQMDKLIIRQGAFGILQSLCIMVEVMTGLEIEEGAVQHLDSLQLLCKNLNGFSSTTIHSLPLLKEVALHDELSNEIKQDWKGAAKNHPRRPKVLFKLKGSELAAGTRTAPTTTNTLAQEAAIGNEPAENFESPVVPPTDITVSTTPGDISTEVSVQVATSKIGMTITPQAISNGESVQVSTSEMGTENAAELPVAPATTDNTTLSRTHNTFASAQQEYPEQVDGDGQHDDHQAEDTNNFHEQNDLVSENGLSSNMASFKNEMEGVAV
ncbi:hypothetical protein ZWY2020_000695 [Hordeum vulgare]|nr:hypothetical protein ZWY2020_000695 [Hordeum vulgare]